MRTLLTGFEPFGKLEANPSQLIVERIRSAGRDDVVAEVLPVRYAVAGEQIRDLIRQVQPGAVICLGVARRAAAIRLERVALNVDDTQDPDNAGEAPAGQLIVPGGPVGYWSTLPLATMLAALQAQDIPACISNHAGTYLCNHVFYVARHEIDQRGSAAPCGFIHVPLMREQTQSEDELARSLPLDTLVEAVACCLEVVAMETQQ